MNIRCQKGSRRGTEGPPASWIRALALENEPRMTGEPQVRTIFSIGETVTRFEQSSSSPLPGQTNADQHGHGHRNHQQIDGHALLQLSYAPGQPDAGGQHLGLHAWWCQRGPAPGRTLPGCAPRRRGGGHAAPPSASRARPPASACSRASWPLLPGVRRGGQIPRAWCGRRRRRRQRTRQAPRRQWCK